MLCSRNNIDQFPKTFSNQPFYHAKKKKKYHTVLVVVPQGQLVGAFASLPKYIFFPRPMFPQIISDALKLAQIWQFKHRNGKFLPASHLGVHMHFFFFFFTFLPHSKFLFAPPPNFGAGAAWCRHWPHSHSYLVHSNLKNQVLDICLNHI